MLKSISWISSFNLAKKSGFQWVRDISFINMHYQKIEFRGNIVQKYNHAIEMSF